MRLFLQRLKNKLTYIFQGTRTQDRKKLGKVGEVIAYRYLKRRGYTILEKNYKTRMGEIDIVALDGDILAFVEVKMRRSDIYGLPEEAINLKKMRKLQWLAQLYIKHKNLYNRKVRFDVVSILARKGFCRKSIRLIKNAFYAEE